LNDIDNPAIREKIRTARELYESHGAAMALDRGIGSLGETLAAKISASRRAMLDLGVVATCKFCEEVEGGSCCGAGIENKYDPVLLLATLLLGGTLPESRCFHDSCYFLGKNGCLLTVRHVLCVNYICRKIKNTLTVEGLMKLQQTMGEELDTEFIFHERIKGFLRSRVDGR
jgi:hypothetical protein